MTIKLLTPKTIWEVAGMQQQIRKLDVSQKKNKEAIEQRLLTSTKSFINNYPTVKLVSYMAEKKNEKLRKHEMEMMKLMFDIYLKLLYF